MKILKHVPPSFLAGVSLYSCTANNHVHGAPPHDIRRHACGGPPHKGSSSSRRTPPRTETHVAQEARRMPIALQVSSAIVVTPRDVVSLVLQQQLLAPATMHRHHPPPLQHPLPTPRRRQSAALYCNRVPCSLWLDGLFAICLVRRPHIIRRLAILSL